MIAKSMTDRLTEASKLTFHLGTTDPTMRRIASWLFTISESKEYLVKLIPKLWKRHGREDLKLVGLILANMQENPWPVLLSLLNPSEPIECLLESIEEIIRAGHIIPSSLELSKWVSKGGIHHQTVVLIMAVANQYDREVIISAPLGGDIFERVRKRALE